MRLSATQPAHRPGRTKLNDCAAQMLSATLNADPRNAGRTKEKARMPRPCVATSGLKLLPRYRRLLSHLRLEVPSKQTVVSL